MSRIPVVSACVLAAALLAPTIPEHAALEGQESGALIGTLFDQQTLQPLAGGTVEVGQTGVLTQTGSDGSFRVADLPAGPTTFRLTAPGYSTAVEQIDIDPGEVIFQQFAILPIGATLGEVLVLTGRNRPAGYSNSVVPSDETGRARTAAEMLAQQVPGLSMHSRDGNVGGGASIVIRGISSLTQSSAPAIYLDGVRLGQGSGGGAAVGSIPAFDILDAIPASDVRRIRVLRGSSAEARYGDSSNGVILVETHSQYPE